MDLPERLSPEAFWAMYDDGEQQVRRVAAGTTTFGLAGWPGGDKATGEWDRPYPQLKPSG
ncbi:hypothetical protein IWX65_000310 [Arthrobacter sp. CAN_A214]|uniref:hypothetical protein n=1 Tax=Arthrobacter sp. CAN_A214 TaxID=2787720 RepID=UPI0018CBC882